MAQVAMRSVMFVERLELEFAGSQFSHALTLGDVDSDGSNELVVGNADGQLALFKGEHSNKPWKRASGLGTITCVGVGDVLNSGKNAVVCVNTEGRCHIFATEALTSSEPSRAPGAVGGGGDQKSGARIIKPTFSQQLAPNAKVILIANLSPVVSTELYVGFTDRGVAAYRWNADLSSLQLIERWTLPGQIGSLSVASTMSGAVQLLVSQPGGTYTPLCYSTEATSGSPHPNLKRKPKPVMIQLSTMGKPQRRNPTASTEVIGHISSQSKQLHGYRGGNNTVALCTLDGAIRLLRDGQKEWELQVDHSLFAISKLDVTGSGEDALVVCAWDGMTYIVNQQKNVVKFQFEENVSAFCAGYYGQSNGGNMPCLIYSTFSNKIYVYHDIILPSIASSNLLLTLDKLSSTQGLPSEVAVQLEGLDDSERQKLLHKCLYGCLQHGHTEELETLTS